MIKGDEGKPMTLLERISDEPCEPEAYIDYLLNHFRKYRATVSGWTNDRDSDKPTAKECVMQQLAFFIIDLENIKRKMNRPRLTSSEDKV